MNQTAFETCQVSAAAKNILCILLYFDQFGYPLTAAEIIDRSGVASRAGVYKELGMLTTQGFIFRFGGFYTTQNNYQLVKRRLDGNDLAVKYLRKARRISAIISHFPFVRSVMLSGSISKMYMDEKSDIDYFVITAPGRLWIARLFFVLFHKLVLLNSTKLFCYNYMIASDHPGIAKRNTYTATEIVTLIPTYGSRGYHQFLETNAWVKDFFPNFPIPVRDGIKEGDSIIKRFLERLFSGSMGEWLDIYLMKHTERRWHKRQPPKMFSDPEAYMNLTRHTAKGHTQDHYPRILKAYEENIRNFEKRFGFSLSQDDSEKYHF